MVADVVGRHAELATIGEFLASAPSGPRALVVEGEPGIGKTTILRAALAAATGLHVLSARPAAGEMELPHASLADLLESVPPVAIAALARPQHVALEAALAREAPEGRRRPCALARPARAASALGAAGELRARRR